MLSPFPVYLLQGPYPLPSSPASMRVLSHFHLTNLAFLYTGTSSLLKRPYLASMGGEAFGLPSFLLVILFIYISNIIPFLCFPSTNPLSFSLSSLLLWGSSATHIFPPCNPGIPLLWGIKFPQDKRSPLPVMSDKALLCYIGSWSHVYFLIGGLVLGSSRGSGCLILLFFLWGCKPLQLLQSYSLLLNWGPCAQSSSWAQAPTSEWSGSGRHLWTKCQASVIKHFFASAIVSEFGVWRWDGCLGGVVSGWPFLQSLLFVSAFPLDRINSGFIFLWWWFHP